MIRGIHRNRNSEIEKSMPTSQESNSNPILRGEFLSCQLSFKVYYIFVAQKLRKFENFLAKAYNLTIPPLVDKLNNLEFCQMALCVFYGLAVLGFGSWIVDGPKAGKRRVLKRTGQLFINA